MTKGLLQSIRHRNTLYKWYLRNPSDQNASVYKSYRNLLTGLIRKTKSKYFHNEFLLNKSNINRTWKTINSLLNKSKPSENSVFNLNGKTVTEPTTISNSFNNFFTSIGPSLANRIPDTQTDYLSISTIHLLTPCISIPPRRMKFVTLLNHSKITKQLVWMNTVRESSNT